MLEIFVKGLVIALFLAGMFLTFYESVLPIWEKRPIDVLILSGALIISSFEIIKNFLEY